MRRVAVIGDARSVSARLRDIVGERRDDVAWATRWSVRMNDGTEYVAVLDPRNAAGCEFTQIDECYGASTELRETIRHRLRPEGGVS